MIFIVSIIAFAGIGLIAGVLAGLLGIGGGIVTVPCLVLALKLMNFPPDSFMHIAIGTSLAAMVFNSFSSFYTHNKKKGVKFSIVRPMALGILFGSFIGALLAKVLPGSFLQIFFGAFECLLGIRFLFKEKKIKTMRKLPHFFSLSGIALGVSTLSTMLGIGGGLVNVPILTYFHVPLKKAIGTSSALSFLISLLGAIFFLIMGMQDTSYPSTFGYIYIPAFVAISIASFFAAPLGVKLTHKMPAAILRRIFGAVLLLGGMSMIIS